MGASLLPITADGLTDYLWNVELPHRRSGLWAGTAEEILRRGCFVGSKIDQFAFLSRTMEYAREYIHRREKEDVSVESGTVFLADRLTGSKGRFVRKWYAPEGGVWGTMIYVNTLLPKSRLLLPLALGISCCEAIRETGIDDVSIRWINDILIAGKKVAGFLLEGFHGNISGEEYTLTGFGINVNNCGFPRELQETAVSLREYLGHPVDLPQFVYRFLAKLSFNLGLVAFEEDTFLQEERWSGRNGRHALIERWCELSDSVGRKVDFGFDVMTSPQFKATVTALSDDGGLVMQLADGSVITEYSGEIRYCT